MGKSKSMKLRLHNSRPDAYLSYQKFAVCPQMMKPRPIKRSLKNIRQICRPTLSFAR
jgi:hypothetical protein